ncbi:hepatitis A virus cellular receptor 2 [Octodon degus]|uniref:Hepatitis A virus cellular receptor 2 n=1 Tax=Octodon degus TaxID=10160 RepID=A0A6P6EA25_OCTDE|nr:hepatitis A virus cellular receptor 2 [Octodon degus]
MFSPPSFECVLLLLLLLLTRSLEEVTTVELGQNAQLLCTYRLPASGHPVPVCWGRGACPLSDCHSVLLRTNGGSVTFRTSRRYMLQRSLYNGDVSLTITNVTLGDSGTYCCRIQFPGIMNDHKFNKHLVITPSKVTPAPTAQRDGTATLARTLTTKGHGPETQTLETHDEKNLTQTFILAGEFQASGATKRKGVYIGVGVSAGVILVFISSALIFLCYSHRKKTPQKASLITLANLPPSGLANAVAEGIRSEENIYTIEENVYATEENVYTTEEGTYTMEEHIYSTEENVYEVEDPSDHYCSVVRA